MLTIEVRLGRLTLCSRLLFGALPLAAVIACGGASTLDTSNDKGGPGGGGHGNHEGGAGGSAASSGHEGNLAGSGGARAGSGGTGGDGMAGNGASAGSAGESGGNGGNGGSGGSGGSAGMGVAGSGGSTAICHAFPPTPCGGGAITLSRSCVTDAMATVGTSLPLSTCRTMCETMFTFQCSVSAVQDATITVQCSTGCPVGNQ